MKFDYSSSYEHSPEHFEKFKQFDLFLEKLSLEYPEEFTKELYVTGKFIAVGIGRNDVIYNPSPDMPDSIEREIRRELKRLYP